MIRKGTKIYPNTAKEKIEQAVAAPPNAKDITKAKPVAKSKKK